MFYENRTKPKFILSFINFLVFFPYALCMIYIWMHDKRARAWNSFRARPLDTWYIEQCISKANIIMNWICVYVCGPTVDCLWRCPKSNTTLSRINTPPFSIPRSPEMKRSFFHNYHLRQSIAGGIGSVPAQPLSTQISSSVGCSHPSPTEIALNRRKMYITEVPTKNGIGLVRIQTPKPPPTPPPPPPQPPFLL